MQFCNKKHLSAITCTLLFLFASNLRAADAPKPEKPAAKPTTQAIAKFESAKTANKLYLALKAKDLPKSKTFIAQLPQPVKDLDRCLERLSKIFFDEKLEFTALD